MLGSNCPYLIYLCLFGENACHKCFHSAVTTASHVDSILYLSAMYVYVSLCIRICLIELEIPPKQPPTWNVVKLIRVQLRLAELECGL